MDFSHLDKKYFIDNEVYNCPFCKRNNVSYFVLQEFSFNWENDKDCYGYLVRCSSCSKESLHLCNESIAIQQKSFGYYKFLSDIDIDKKIFFSQPTSFFTLDNRIPKILRDLISESEQCQKANLLVGSSACLRKAIYELITFEKVEIINDKTNRIKYEESIKNLKSKYPNIASEYFDVLANIQELVSDNLHENSWKEWDSKKIKILIELVKNILEEIFVLPEVRKSKMKVLDKLKDTFNTQK